MAVTALVVLEVEDDGLAVSFLDEGSQGKGICTQSLDSGLVYLNLRLHGLGCWLFWLFFFGLGLGLHGLGLLGLLGLWLHGLGLLGLRLLRLRLHGLRLLGLRLLGCWLFYFGLGGLRLGLLGFEILFDIFLDLIDDFISNVFSLVFEVLIRAGGVRVHNHTRFVDDDDIHLFTVGAFDLGDFGGVLLFIGEY